MASGREKVLALDVGGTRTRGVLYGIDGKPEVRAEIYTRLDDFDGWLSELCAFWGNQSFEAIGLAVAGNVNGGVLTGSGNLPGWKGVHLASHVMMKFDRRPVAVLNDCEAAAYGEYANIGSSFVYVIWGTGVGAAVVEVRDGKVSVRPTELGHMIIDFRSGVKCGCGGLGHLEGAVGGGNLEGNFGMSAVKMGDWHWSETLKLMAVGLRNISIGELNLPIVMGGGVILKQQHRLPQLQEMVAALKAPAAVPELSVARHRDDSGLLGAALAARQLLN